MFSFFFFFNDTATTEIYTLSLHDALPIFTRQPGDPGRSGSQKRNGRLDGERHQIEIPPARRAGAPQEVRQVTAVVVSLHGHDAVEEVLRLARQRSEEHTSELQSQSNLVCRLLLEKKKKKTTCDLSCVL